MRIQGVNPEETSEAIHRVLESQRKKWGESLPNHRIYARVPEIFQGAQGMWRGLSSAGHLESTLPPLINRRVALINGCVF